MVHFSHVISNSEITSPLSPDVSETEVRGIMEELLCSLPQKLNTGGSSAMAITTVFMAVEELYNAVSNQLQSTEVIQQSAVVVTSILNRILLSTGAPRCSHNMCGLWIYSVSVQIDLGLIQLRTQDRKMRPTTTWQ